MKNYPDICENNVYEDTITVYDRMYTYDEMKVMTIVHDEVTRLCEINSKARDLDYEDLCVISHEIYKVWLDWDPKDARCQELLNDHPWIGIENFEEEGYIQAYARRTAERYIQYYLYNIA